MTTAERRWERTIEARVTIIFVGGLMVLMLLGFARIKTVTDDLRATQGRLLQTQTALISEQARACALRKAGRANTNQHERLPLRAAFNYLASLVQPAASKQTDPRQRAATLAFARRFEKYARQVQPLPNPNC